MPSADSSPEDPHEPGADGAGSPAGFDVEALWQLVEGDGGGEVDPLVGARLGDVEIVRFIAAGGMGRVYEGVQDQPRRTVAVKVPPPGAIDSTNMRRFVREAAIIGQIDHPAVCKIFSASVQPTVAGAVPYFVMEFVPGAMPITTRAVQYALPLVARVRLFTEACAGVAAAHGAGIAHRDLKASNILIGDDGRARVIDFGVARAFRGSPHGSALTRTGGFIGTLSTAAPECLDDVARDADARSDVWSLGVILHELLTGVPPYGITPSSIVATIAAIKAFRSHLATGRRSPIHRELAGVVDACLQQDPAKRPADAGAVAARLGSLLDKGVDHPDWKVTTLPAAAPPRVSRRAMAAACAALAGSTLVVAARRLIAPPAVEAGADWIGRLPPEHSDWQTPTSLPNASFRFGVVDVFDDDADRYLVEATGMLKWREGFNRDETSYWQPTTKGVEGRLVYTFELPGPSRRAHLRAHCSVFDEDTEIAVLGTGAGAIDVSRDGVGWVSLVDGIEPRRWGSDVVWFGILPDAVLGTDAIWLRIRLLAGGRGNPTVYSPAQFARSGPMERQNRWWRLLVEAECEPAKEADGQAAAEIPAGS
ncbi:MAG: serine/threonine-protein kinase [Planctomycetaceae bacterium]